ncbi:Uncharacterized protein HZ326_9475 [Fusarium oxysporum f. sp. albedinis]|nr:Uncharacterized protein HZ326_9475 [Fusarium oxysporum f. sp. albedinis]
MCLKGPIPDRIQRTTIRSTETYHSLPVIMRRATSHRGAASQERPYPCVIADRFPGKCKKSFNNIEKLK